MRKKELISARSEYLKFRNKEFSDKSLRDRLLSLTSKPRSARNFVKRLKWLNTRVFTLKYQMFREAGLSPRDAFTMISQVMLNDYRKIYDLKPV